MSIPRPVRTAVLLGGLLLAAPTPMLAKLMFRTDDVYVRGAGLIIIADTVATVRGPGGGFAIVEPRDVLAGASPGPRIRVRNYLDTDEDMPVFRVGDKSLLFLNPDETTPGSYACFGATAGKRDYAPERAAAWEKLIDRITRLAGANAIPAGDERTRRLVGLLDSEDSSLAAAASNYLNYLATGTEDEDWLVKPPRNSSDWSWEDYFQRNVVAHRQKWKRWWLDTHH